MEKNEVDKMFATVKIAHEELVNLAFETGFIKRKRSISGPDVLYALCAESIHGTVSYNDIAAQIESQSGVCVSKQALWKKVTEPCLNFFQKVLELVIMGKLHKTQIDIIRNSKFKRILVQDSTIIRLPTKLFCDYSGVSNQVSKVCNARIQGTYDILNECFVTFSIDPYSKNDLIAAPELKLEDGDLSLRDRGYLIYDEIQRHVDSGADCIYRYKFGITLLDPVTENPINIIDELKKRPALDMIVKLNNDKKTLVRITASPIDEKTANIRRLKAKQEKKRLLPKNTSGRYHGQYS